MTDLEPCDLPSILSPKPAEFVRCSGRTVQSVLGPCKVCLGKATGYHYEAVSCNGCRSFFRRVITEKLSYKCSSQNTCYEDFSPWDPLPKCRSCRFKKCVKVGMNPLAIHSELREHKEKHIDQNPDTLPKVPFRCNDRYEIQCQIVMSPKSVEMQISELIEHLVYLDKKTNSFLNCSYNPKDFPTLREAVNDEVSILGLGDQMGPMTGWPIPQEAAEQFRKSIPAFGTGKLPANMKRWLPYEILTIIEMTKTFDFFRKLSERDRYFLFRDTLLMVTNLTRSYFSVEKGSDEISHPDGTTPPIRHSEWCSAEIHQRHYGEIGRRAIGGLIRKKMTKTEYLLIRAILLCNSAAPEISKEARETLFMERKKYTMALLNYTMTGHGSGGPGRFAELLNIIDILERQQKDQRDVYLLVRFYRSKQFRIPLYDEVLLTI